MVAQLYALSRYMVPERDWTWLKTIKRRLERLARPKSKPSLPFTSATLAAIGLTIVDEAEKDSAAHHGQPLEKQSLLYRDGLLIALVALVPLRRRTAASLVLGENILCRNGNWHLAISGKNTKTQVSIEGVLPYWLGDCLTRFVDVYRPGLAGARVSQHLFPSHKRGPLSPIGMCAAFQARILERTGKRISFHDARRIAATTIAIKDHQNVAVASDLLTHAKHQITQGYYICASQTVAIKTIYEAIAKRRTMKTRTS